MIDLLLFLALFIREAARGKKRAQFLLKKLHFAPLPDPKGREVIWIHAVSVGEVKAALPLFQALLEKHPGAFFLLTTTTETGQKEAKRLFGKADAILPLPLDLKRTVRRVVSHFRPRFFYLIETDVWPRLLEAVRMHGGRVYLVSGKMSERTARRLHRFPRVGRWLFSSFSGACLQSKEHKKRFAPFFEGKPLRVTGNLKFDAAPEAVDLPFWQKRYASDLPWIALTCTHPGEEKLLLQELLPLPVRIFLAPRHPERFSLVAGELAASGVSFCRLEEPCSFTHRVVLVDAMGKLPILYSLSTIAVVGGSFLPGVGGHNVLEPCLYGCFSLFGPHMEGQKEIAAHVLEEKLGLQCSLSELKAALEVQLLSLSPQKRLPKGSRKITEATLDAVASMEKALA